VPAFLPLPRSPAAPISSASSLPLSPRNKFAAAQAQPLSPSPKWRMRRAMLPQKPPHPSSFSTTSKRRKTPVNPSFSQTSLVSSTFLTSFFPTSLQPLSRLPEHVPAPSPRTCNGFENYVRRVRQRGSARAGRAEGISPAPSGSGTPPSSHIINLDSDDDL